MSPRSLSWACCLAPAIRRPNCSSDGKFMAEVFYHTVPTDWRRGEKYRFLDDKENTTRVEWQRLQPDSKHTWLRQGLADEFETFLPLGTKLAKQMEVGGEGAIFKTYS